MYNDYWAHALEPVLWNKGSCRSENPERHDQRKPMKQQRSRVAKNNNKIFKKNYSFHFYLKHPENHEPWTDMAVLHCKSIFGRLGKTKWSLWPGRQDEQIIECPWQPTPVVLPGESHGQRRLQSMGSQRVGHDWATNTQHTKVRLVKVIVFPVVMYGCESWTIKKAECRRVQSNRKRHLHLCYLLWMKFCEYPFRYID